MDAADFSAVLSEVRRFVRDRVVPLEAEIDEKDEMPADIREAAKKMGLFGFALPEEYGGLGLSMYEEAQLMFELGYTTPSLRSMFGTNNGIAGHVLMVGGTEEQKAHWLPRIASGDVLASFALTEPDAGSDPSTLTTKAHLDGDEWVINGAKRYITNAPLADVFMVFARTDPDAPRTRGISTFLVPAGTPGLTVAPKDHKMGQFGAWTADVFFDDVRVPASALVGGEAGLNRGFPTAMGCIAHGRVHISALMVGMAERLVDESVAYASTRKQSGKLIGSFQLVQGLIADSQTDYYAGRATVLEAARAFDAGTDTKIGPSCTKYFASEMVWRGADRAGAGPRGAGGKRGGGGGRLFPRAPPVRLLHGTHPHHHGIH